ncbi:hypothetical protein [Bacillus marasmi]|uniref:hypothetical protein n=1 Tax=Bacillus marasmi TaxID=1926279 RepID=UPI0011C7AD54|nr:hypothetical protein [Bacillus marasmi]
MNEEMKSLLRDVLKEEFAEVHQTVCKLRKDVDEFRADTKERYEKLETAMSDIGLRLDAIENSYEVMSRSLDKLEHDHARKEKKISSIIVQYQHLESFITKEIRRLSSMNMNQKTIDLLSARSIQHEADIRELNRVIQENPGHLS